jgi:hypothetical protein
MPTTPAAFAYYVSICQTIFGHAFTSNQVTPKNGPEHTAVYQTCGGSPSLDRNLHPGGHRHRANPAVLPDKIDDAPAVIALLDVREHQRRYLGSAESAADQDRKNGAIAQLLHCGGIRGAKQRLPRGDSQFPVRIPTDLTLFTRLMPAANSGASIPLSTASPASLRMADIRIMMDDEPSLRASSDARQALTVALLKPGRGSSLNHAMNSSSAMLYTRRVIGEERRCPAPPPSVCTNLRPLRPKSFIFESFYWSLSLAISCGHYLRWPRTSSD